MIGSTVSHYMILERLGEGGMGVVYKAEDTRLKRIVALKFLHEDAFEDAGQRANFIREAQTAAALENPSICTIYEIGEDGDQIFISMAYVEGTNLREQLQSGPLALDDAIRIVSQVGRGLEAAHRRDIFHCDISPSNIIVTEDGNAKIMDFGLARIAGMASPATTSDAYRTYGTAAYMSPEQVRGEPIDARTDIWSLGVCLYELVTGELPFRGDYGPAVFYSIVNETPSPVSSLRPDLPPQLDHIVAKAMAKRPSDRYQHIIEFVGDIERIADIKNDAEIATDSIEPAVAVLPFVNMTPDIEQEFFCDGIAEDIINGLTQIGGLRVVARTSAFAFKGKTEDIREIGRKLGVHAVLEGSVRRWDDTLRVTAQLINVADGYHLWSQRYDRKMEDVFAVQDEISQEIVRRLRVGLVAEGAGANLKRYTGNFDAYTYYLKGRFHWNKRNEEGIRKGIEYFERAIAEDPAYALAYAGLADSYNLLGFYCVRRPTDVFPKAKRAARRALELDGDLAEAYASLAFARMFHDWDWRGAEADFKHSIDLNPKYPTVYHWYAEYLVLSGRMEEATLQSKRALQTDPLSLIINTLFGWVLHFGRKYKEAIKQHKRTLELDSRFVPAHFFLGLAYVQTGTYDDAFEEFDLASFLFGQSNLALAAKCYAYAAAGKRDETERLLADLDERSAREYVPAYYTAAAYAALGDDSAALDRLEQARDDRDVWLSFLRVDPIWEGFRGHRRFADLLNTVSPPT